MVQHEAVPLGAVCDSPEQAHERRVRGDRWARKEARERAAEPERVSERSDAQSGEAAAWSLRQVQAVGVLVADERAAERGRAVEPSALGAADCRAQQRARQSPRRRVGLQDVHVDGLKSRLGERERRARVVRICYAEQPPDVPARAFFTSLLRVFLASCVCV